MNYSKNSAYIGQEFGKWKVISLAGNSDKYGRSQVEVRCVCGKERLHVLNYLKKGRTKQCAECSRNNARYRHLSLDNTKIGKWFVIKEAPSKFGSKRYLCKCDCGKQKEIYAQTLRHGKSRGCIDCRNKKHGLSKSNLYKVWRSMLNRCQSASHKAYKWYGARGIKVCERWKDFLNFFEDMGECPKGLSLDRINNDGSYELLNCRWATTLEQNNNRRISRKVKLSLKK